MNHFPRGWIILPSHVSAHLTVLCTKKCTRLFPRRKTEEERQKKEDERARREFIRQEYLRRKQLKLMEDMDTVIKPRPQGAKQKKQRPKSIHRDHIESPKTPIKGPPGNTCIVRSLFIATAARAGTLAGGARGWTAHSLCAEPEWAEDASGDLSVLCVHAYGQQSKRRGWTSSLNTNLAGSSPSDVSSLDH